MFLQLLAEAPAKESVFAYLLNQFSWQQTGDFFLRMIVACVCGAGIGFDAQVCEEADISKAKDFLNKLKLGKLVYITTALKTIFNAPRIEAEITTDGEVKKFNALLMASVMNEPYQGGGFGTPQGGSFGSAPSYPGSTDNSFGSSQSYQGGSFGAPQGGSSEASQSSQDMGFFIKKDEQTLS